MEFTKKFMTKMEDVIDCKIRDINVIDSADDSFLVIKTDNGFLVFDESFDEIDEDTFRDQKDLDHNDLLDLGMISSDTHKALELCYDFELKDMEYHDLEILYETIGKLINK
jgi:hypothetical protein